MRRLLHRIFFAALLLAAACSLGLWLLLHTARGRDVVAAALSRRLSASPGRAVEIRGLGGSLPVRGRAREVVVRDRDGAWLTLRDVAWQATWRDLAQFRISHVQVDELLVSRRPAGGPESGARAEAWPLAGVDDARVERLVLSHDVLGTALVLRVTGRFESFGTAARVAAQADRLDAPGRLVGSGVVERAGGVWLDARYEEPSPGWASSWLHAWNVTSVSAQVTATGGAGAWHGTLRAVDGRAREVVARWRWADEGPSEARAFLRVAGLALLADYVAAAGQTNLSVKAALARDGNSWSAKGLANLVRAADGGWEGTFAAHSIAAPGFWSDALTGVVRAVQAPAGWHGQLRFGASHARCGGWSVERADGGADLVIADGTYSWTNARLEATGARLVSSGSWSARGGEAHLEVAQLSLGDLPAGRWLGGMVGGQIVVSGTSEEPTVDGRVIVTGLVPRVPSHIVARSAEGTLAFAYAHRRLRASAQLAGWTEDAIRADAEIPARGSLWPPSVQVQADEPLRASLRFAHDLQRLGEVTDLRGTRVRGSLAGELQVAGTWSRPDVQGRVSWRDGALEIPDSGTVLRDLEVVLVGDREALVLETARARDESGGRLGAQGRIRLLPEEHFPVAAEIHADRAMLIRTDTIRGALDGSVAVTGTLRQVTLAGALAARDVAVRLRPSRPPVPVLPVAGLAQAAAQPAHGRPAAWRSRIALALDVKSREIGVTGRGLESTWRAGLRIGGTAAAPLVRGSVQVERGYFLFMGRRFAIESGTLGLDGPWPPEPQLDIVATAPAADLVARLQVTGGAGQPQLVLESEPTYPPDEILARLLFGKSADRITALQAVRLAHGLNVLRDRGNTLDLLSRGQSLLRVDQIELKQTEEASSEISSVSVGKYLGSRVYVQGEKGLAGSGDRVAIEVELAPSLLLQTETTPGIREGIGLQWRRDY